MASSFADPKLSNAIASDVPSIQELLNYLAQANPGLGSNYPTDSIRIVATDADKTKYQIQRFNGSSWVTAGQLQHDVTSLRGYAPSTSASAGTIPVYNSSGKLVGSITGTAATASKLASAVNIQVGGIAASTAQSFNGSTAITIPINSITVNNAADNALNGTVSQAHGGTGRTDGAAEDVVFSYNSQILMAKDYGQIGSSSVAKWSASAPSDADSFVVPGNYVVNTNSTGWAAKKWPAAISQSANLRVTNDGETMLHQTLSGGEPFQMWGRCSTNGGASWSSWQPLSNGYSGALELYISKSGSDLNSGLDSSYPVLTFNRAMAIAKGLLGGSSTSFVIFHFGSGDWGNLAIYPVPFLIVIAPYDALRATAYSSSLPQFGSFNLYGPIWVDIGAICMRRLYAERGAVAYIYYGYKRISTFRAYTSSTIIFESQNASTNVVEMGINPLDGYPIYITENACVIMGYITIKLGANITPASHFIYVERFGKLYVITGRTLFNASGYSITGGKIAVQVTSDLLTGEAAGAYAWANTIPATGDVAFYNGARINGYIKNQAIDSAVVHLAGSETITGQKTINVAGMALILKNPNFARADSVTKTQYEYIEIHDKNDVPLGQLTFYKGADGTHGLYIYAWGIDGNGGRLGIYRDSSGASFADMPTPTAASNSQAGATTAWVRARLSEDRDADVPVGTVIFYYGTLVTRSQAIDFFNNDIRKVQKQLLAEEEKARAIRATAETEILPPDDEINYLQLLLNYEQRMRAAIPEEGSDVTLYDAQGNAVTNEVSFPIYQMDGFPYAIPNTYWVRATTAARVLVASGNDSYEYNTTGGSFTHTHSVSGAVSIGDTTLDTASTASHWHGQSTVGQRTTGTGAWQEGNWQATYQTLSNQKHVTQDRGGGGSHTHSLTLGSTGSGSNMQPYWVLHCLRRAK